MLHRDLLLFHSQRRPWRRLLWRAALSGSLTLGPWLARPAGAADGPNSSIFSGQLPQQAAGALGAAAAGAVGGASPTSWYEVALPPPKEVKVQDIVTIRVDLGARVISEGEMQRRKNATYNAVLNNWVVLEGLKAIKPAPQTEGDQKIQGQFNQLLRTTGEMETTESMKFEIAAKVAAVLPNGTLILEAHREIRNNNEVWMHSLSGLCRREDIGPGNIVLSKDLADLKIVKREQGHVRDSYKRGWFQRWLDQFHPF
jgi:flagellar L-ring protein precursor FlgH